MVIADTGFWLALANQKDQHHAMAHVRLTYRWKQKKPFQNLLLDTQTR
jgi:predicted nucleic acid-binding protein